MAVTNLNDVMLSGCTCDYSDRVDTDGSGSVSVMAFFLTMLRYRISGNFYVRKLMRLKSMRDYIFANLNNRKIKNTVYFNNANVITRTSEDGG